MARQYFHRRCFHTPRLSLAALLVACAACKREAPRPAPAEPVIQAEPEGSSGARARTPPEPDAVAPAPPANPPPLRCRVLVNLATTPNPSRHDTLHVVDVRVDDKISLSAGPGLVLQDGAGLLGLQLLHYEVTSRFKTTKVIRHWSTLLARKLPDGQPVVWIDGEPELDELKDMGGDWFSVNSFTLSATVGPFVSLSSHHSVDTGALYFGDVWPALTFAAPDGQRAALPVVVGASAVERVKEQLRALPGEPPEDALGEQLDGFALAFGGVEGKPRGLSLLVGSGTPHPGSRFLFDGVPPGLWAHLSASPSNPAQVGPPASCAEVEVGGGALRVRRRSDGSETRLPLPPHLRQAQLLGVAWTSIDSSFSLAQLPPSGYATERAIKGAPPVKFR